MGTTSRVTTTTRTRRPGRDYDPVPAAGQQPARLRGPRLPRVGHGSRLRRERRRVDLHGDYDNDTHFEHMKIGPGMAPGATLYALKVFGCAGSTDVVGEALDWAADPNGDGDLSDHLDVVNMSLGQRLRLAARTPTPSATNNAVVAGITVVASMGNNSDLFETGGSPGRRRPLDRRRGQRRPGRHLRRPRRGRRTASTSPCSSRSGPPPTTGPASRGITDGNLVKIGDWTQPPSATNNTDGCDTLSPADAAIVDGNVPLLFWTDSDTDRRCGSAGRSGKVKAAGATAAVLGDDQHRFAAGITGDVDIPVMEVNDDGTAALLAAVNAHPGNVDVTLTNALANTTKLASLRRQRPH